MIKIRYFIVLLFFAMPSKSMFRVAQQRATSFKPVTTVVSHVSRRTLSTADDYYREAYDPGRPLLPECCEPQDSWYPHASSASIRPTLILNQYCYENAAKWRKLGSQCFDLNSVLWRLCRNYKDMCDAQCVQMRKLDTPGLRTALVSALVSISKVNDVEAEQFRRSIDDGVGAEKFLGNPVPFLAIPVFCYHHEHMEEALQSKPYLRRVLGSLSQGYVSMLAAEKAFVEARCAQLRQERCMVGRYIAASDYPYNYKIEWYKNLKEQYDNAIESNNQEIRRLEGL